MIAAVDKLDSIKNLVTFGSMKFEEAVKKFSQDEETNKSSGDVMNPATGSNFFEADQLEFETYQAIEDLKIGEISEPVKYTRADGTEAYRIVMLKSETEPHITNLKDDYDKIQAVALSEKQMKVMNQWIREKIGETYVKYDPIFKGCEEMKQWDTTTGSR